MIKEKETYVSPITETLELRFEGTLLDASDPNSDVNGDRSGYDFFNLDF